MTSTKLYMLWGTLALSSIVFIEPAPYDFAMVLLCAYFLVTGLRIPAGLILPLWLAGLFLLANVISIVAAEPNIAQPHFYLAYYAALTGYLFLTWLFFAAVVYADPNGTLPMIWKGYAVAALIAALCAYAGYFGLVPNAEVFLKMGRAKGPFKDPNVFGPFIVPVVLYLLTVRSHQQPIRELGRLAVALFLMGAILISFSRGAWAHFILSFFFLLGLTFLTSKSLSDYLRISVLAIASVLIVVALALTALTSPHTSEMMKKRAALTQSYDVEAGGRFSTQRAALDTIARYPLGIGPNRTQSQLGRVPHNVFLKVTAENGWLGGIAFVGLILLTLWRGFWSCFVFRRHQQLFIVAYASFVGAVAESLVIDSLHWRHFFLLMGILWGLLLRTDREASDKIKSDTCPQTRPAILYP